MHIQVKATGISGTARLRQVVTEKLNAALTEFAECIEAVSVVLRDINGPDRGGVDKLCRIVVNLKHQAVVVVETLGSDMEQAIACVAERLPLNIARQLARYGGEHALA